MSRSNLDLKLGRLTSRHKSSDIQMLSTVPTWPRQGVSNSKTNKGQCQWNLRLDRKSSNVLYLRFVQSPQYHPDFILLVWSGCEAVTVLHMIDGTVLSLPWSQMWVSTTPRSLSSPCILPSLDNTSVMKVCSSSHSCLMSADLLHDPSHQNNTSWVPENFTLPGPVIELHSAQTRSLCLYSCPKVGLIPFV